MKRFQLFRLVVALSLLSLISIINGRLLLYEVESIGPVRSKYSNSKKGSYKDFELIEEVDAHSSNSYSSYSSPSYYSKPPYPSYYEPPTDPPYTPKSSPSYDPPYYPPPPPPPPKYGSYKKKYHEDEYEEEELHCAKVNVTQSNQAIIQGSLLGDLLGLLNITGLGSLLSGLNIPILG